MSGFKSGRGQRADARRSRHAVLDSATRLLCEQPDASLEDVAASAGVSRQTVYAHFKGRRALLAAVADHATADYIEALDSAQLEQGSAGEALDRFVNVTTEWARSIHRLPTALIETAEAGDTAATHAPVHERIVRLVARGQRAGEFARGLKPDWLATATVVLGHAVSAEVAAGRMSDRQGRQIFRTSLNRIYGRTA